jgi:hypothetical protein
MMRNYVNGLILFLIMIAFALTGCGSKDKEIPMDTFVSIWFKIQDDQSFRQQYPDPVKAPDKSLSVFTEPYGFTGADFKYTKNLIDRDDQRKKEFQDMTLTYIDKLALETLNEIQEKDTLLNKP